MIKAVFFDFGGVLSESGKKGFVRQALADTYGVSLDDLDLEKVQYEWRRSMTDEGQVIKALNHHYGKQVTLDEFYRHLHSQTTRSEAVYELVQRLHKAGIRTGILSNVFTTSAKLLREQGFYEGFDPVILSCEEGYAKPDEELYRIAIERSGVAAAEILFIDDQEKCRPPAERMGMHFLLAVSPQQIVNDTVAIIRRENHTAL